MPITGSQKAPTYALLNVARLGATRLGYVGGGAFVAVGGLPQTGNVKLGTLEIVDELNETPNTCRFRIIGPTTITTGQEVIITLGSQNGRRLFAGHVLAAQQSYWEKPANVRTDVQAVDYTWQFGFPKVTKRYANLSATAIVQDLIATYAAANGFTGLNVATGLPTIPEITFTNEDLGEALSRTANRIGAYWYVDYVKDVHFFFTDTAQTPAPLVPTHRSLDNVTRDTDRSQALTRVYVEGRGSTLLSNVDIGDTILPLEAVDMFQALPDVFLKASFQGSEGGAQHLSFTGVVPGGLGSIVGPGIAPTSAPTVALAAGPGVDVGKHDYAYSWVTGAGETKPSPLATVTHGGPVTAPTVATTVRNDDTGAVNELVAGAWKPGDTVDWAYSWAMQPTFVTSTPLSPTVSIVATVASSWWNVPGHSAKAMAVKVPYSSDPRVKYVYLWHRVNGGAWRVWNYGEPVGQGYDNYPGSPPFEVTLESTATYSDAATPPSVGTAAQQSAISGIAVGPATVTARKVWRTAAGGAQLKLLAVLFDNTSTTLTDSIADSGLGANAPAADTSGLPQPTGTILPYATSIRVSSTAAFEAGGGWAVIGNGEQVIRYNNIAGNDLGLIPITGPGSITAPVSYGATITAAPMLTGIPATGPRSINARALTAGDEIYLVVQCDNGAAQAQLAAAVGGTGIREEWVQDRRLSIGEARARGNATLAERALDQIRVSYTSRDLSTRSGLDIVCNLPAPTNLVGTFKIQHVVINNFRPFPTQYPTFTVQASSSRFSFEDLLRLATRDVAR
jgi:hypothetical protein